MGNEAVKTSKTLSERTASSRGSGGLKLGGGVMAAGVDCPSFSTATEVADDEPPPDSAETLDESRRLRGTAADVGGNGGDGNPATAAMEGEE